MGNRPFQAADYAALKIATNEACEDAKPMHRMAELTRPGMDASRLSRYGNLNEKEFSPIDVAMDIDAISGADRILRAWAKIRGYDLVKREDRVAIESIEVHVGAIGKEAGEVIAASCEAIASRKPITPAKARELLKEVRESADAHDRLENNLLKIVAGN